MSIIVMLIQKQKQISFASGQQKPAGYTADTDKSRLLLFVFPDRKDDFMVELANISDLHGIIKMREGEIWLRKVSDTRELNIDATTMNRISAKLGLERV